MCMSACLCIFVYPGLFLPREFLYPSMDTEYVSHIDVFFMPSWLFICLFLYVAIKASVKSREFCLKSCWDFARHLQSLQSWWEAHLTAATSFYNVSFTVFTLAELQLNVCRDKQNSTTAFSVPRYMKSTYSVKLTVCASICWIPHLIENLQSACTWTLVGSEVEGNYYAEQRKMLFEHLPPQL